MPEILREIIKAHGQSQDILVFSLILARTMPMIFLTPFLGGKTAPNEVKMGMGVMITMLLWPTAVEASGVLPSSAVGYMTLMMKEVLIGFSLGFINAHMFWAMDMAGRIIDTGRGTSMSEVQDPHSKQRATPVGVFYSQLFLLIFFSMGAHSFFIEGYFESFRTLPINEYLDFSAASTSVFVGHIIKTTAQLWQIAVILAAPILAATFITDLVFGILNRVAPQLNAYFMSMPAKAYGGLIMILVALGAILERFEDWVILELQWIEETMKVLLGVHL